jgi:hypothetical protein
MDRSATSTSESELVFGVVCLMDALGFRGIWNRNQPREILDVIRAIKSELDNWFELLNSFRANPQPTPPQWSEADSIQFHAQFVSDTVILAGTCKLPLDVAKRTYEEANPRAGTRARYPSSSGPGFVDRASQTSEAPVPRLRRQRPDAH